MKADGHTGKDIAKYLGVSGRRCTAILPMTRVSPADPAPFGLDTGVALRAGSGTVHLGVIKLLFHPVGTRVWPIWPAGGVYRHPA
jgi:hypothetical protein